jgi:hypothetical protein
MSLRLTALFCALVVGASVSRADEKAHVRVGDIAPGSKFEISTTDHVYRGEMVDPATGEAKLAASIDGLRFTKPRTVYLLGSTQGRQAEAGGLMLVKMNELQTGLCLELGVGSLDARNRQLTEPVQSIHVN